MIFVHHKSNFSTLSHSICFSLQSSWQGSVTHTGTFRTSTNSSWKQYPLKKINHLLPSSDCTSSRSIRFRPWTGSWQVRSDWGGLGISEFLENMKSAYMKLSNRMHLVEPGRVLHSRADHFAPRIDVRVINWTLTNHVVRKSNDKNKWQCWLMSRLATFLIWPPHRSCGGKVSSLFMSKKMAPQSWQTFY